MSDEAPRDAQAEYGFERLGPIVACFLHDLDGVLEHLVDQRGGQALFVRSSGLIRTALNVYRRARGREPRPREAVFDVSRLRPGAAADFAGLIQDAPVSAVIETWASEIPSLVSRALPQHEVRGIAFGGADRGGEPVGSRVLALMTGGAYVPGHPLSGLAWCPSLVEALFRPAGDEIRRLDEVDGALRPMTADGALSEAPQPGCEALFGGVLRYLGDVAASHGYAEIQAHKDAAAVRLADDILFPSRETARLIGGLTGSLVAREGEGAAVADPEARIRTARWTQGQIALECRPVIARERQRAMAPSPAAAQHESAEPRAWDPATVKVAIIMRTMDRLIFLQRALSSVAWQTFDDYVLVVFNDGGDLAGVEAEIASSRLDRRKVVLLDGVQNRGMEAASNAAIRHVRSDYLVIHDDDDSWSADFLARTVAFLDANPGALGVATQANHVEDEICGDRVVARRAAPFNAWMQTVQIGELLAGNMFPPISFLFRRSVYDAVGGFNESLPVLGDWEFNLRVAARGEIAVIPERLANYHYRGASDGGAYANTVVGGVDLHVRYNAIVRRGLLENEDLRALAAAAAIAPMVSDVRRLVRRGPGSDPAAVLTAAADERWCMLEFAKARPERLADLSLPAALEHARRSGVAIPPDFDEAAYLSENPDVARIVQAGGSPSGYVHYLLSGRAEGRRRPLPTRSQRPR